MNSGGQDDEGRGGESIMPDENWWAAVLADEPNFVDGERYLENSFVKPDVTVKPSVMIDWKKIEQIHSNDKIIKVIVEGYNRGGLLVSEKAINGFIPASHLMNLPSNCEEKGRETYLANYVGKKINVKIIEYDPARERIVFSERAALAGEGKRRYLLETVKEKDIVEGTITNITEFGAFVDLGGIEGLIHLSELSWGRVNHPEEIVHLGEKVRALVIQVAGDKERIALSLKQLTQNPWKVLKEKYRPGENVRAVITSVVNYGAFARLPEGLEGLIHISSINIPPGSVLEDYLFRGQDVLVKIVHMEPDKRRLGLSLEKRM